MTTPVETRRLTKRYGDLTAVDGLDLEVRAGEVYGFLGPNGAGKTTTLRMLLGLVRPTSGEVRLFGRAPGNPVTWTGSGRWSRARRTTRTSAAATTCG